MLLELSCEYFKLKADKNVCMLYLDLDIDTFSSVCKTYLNDIFTFQLQVKQNLLIVMLKLFII